MALDSSLNGMRNAIITSLYGRRIGLDSNDYLIGKPLRDIVEGVSSAASTIVTSSR